MTCLVRRDDVMRFFHVVALFYSEFDGKFLSTNSPIFFMFNRASLINAGFSLVKDDFDYIAMHDVDLLPVNSALSYAFPADGPMHIAAPELHPQYHYEKFIGGILLMTSKHFEQVNGMPNKYWGWGMEDDALYARLMDAGMNVSGNQTRLFSPWRTFLANDTQTVRHYKDKQRLDQTFFPK